jgi:hypothetical protein
MFNLDFLKNSWFFQLKELKTWELVFDEWDVDENLYIIISWKVLIGKYTTIEKKEIKELAILNEFDFFWEASLNLNTPKEALVRVIEDVTLIYINWKEWLQNFNAKNPKEWLDLLSYIIDITNKRLVVANKLNTANFEIIRSIIEIENINDKSIYFIIEKIKLITGYDYILYFEINPVISDYLALKYDTREKWKFQDIVIERKKLSNLWEINEIVLKNYNFIQKLSIWNLDLGYMIFWKNTKFSYEDKKLILSISNNLTWLIKQKEILKEEINKKYIKEWSEINN